MVNKVLPYSNVVIKSLISCNILSRFCDDIKKIILEYSDIDIKYLIRDTRFILSNMYPSLYIHIKEKPKLIQNPETQSDYNQPLLSISSNTHSNIKYHNTLNLIRNKKIVNRKKYCKKDKTKNIKYDRSIKYDFLDNSSYIYEIEVKDIFDESRYNIYKLNDYYEIDMEEYYRWKLRDDRHYY
jgi:hypothetical protein